MNNEQLREQQRVDRVVKEIDQRIEALQDNVVSVKEHIVELRKHFWDDVTVNLDNPEDATETAASIRQQAEVLSDRERRHIQAEKQMKLLMKLRPSPYFGRIDFSESGTNEAERIYLGIGSVQNRSGDEFLVYDWRAPISSLYYDYGPGPVAYTTPEGRIEGTMSLKRQFVIRDSHIESMFDTGVTIGDELLQEVLGKQSDAQMKSIVATIQQEQNRIIRNETSRLLIVQGSAGSGKTSAALQRVAYLLYRYRETLRAEQIVLFSPNPMFNSYISTVLPELGEENMQQTTFQEYAEMRVGRTFRLEDPFEQMEYVLSGEGQAQFNARMAGIRFKASRQFMRILDRYAALLKTEKMVFKSLRFRGKTLVSHQQILDKFYSFDASIRIPNRLRLLVEWLLEQLKQHELYERDEPWVDEQIELLDKEVYDRMYRQLRKSKRFSPDTFDDYERERELLAEYVVKEKFKKLRNGVKRLRFVDIPAIYRQLFSDEALFRSLNGEDDVPQAWSDVCLQTIHRIKQRELLYEDAAPYIYLAEQLEGARMHTAVRHVFIDEAQDYSPFQFALLLKLFPYSKFTLLGDLNQAIFAHTENQDGFASIKEWIGDSREAEQYILRRSYRSTRQIIDFTRSFIPGGQEIEPFHRDGKKPTLIQAAYEEDRDERIAGLVRQLRDDNHRTIAIICKSMHESRQAFASLGKRLPLRLIDKETVSFAPGVLVIPSYLAKGVEFDAVIVYDASKQAYGSERLRKLFYTVCTRAMHELHLYYIGEHSPFIDEAHPETYTKQ